MKNTNTAATATTLLEIPLNIKTLNPKTHNTDHTNIFPILFTIFKHRAFVNFAFKTERFHSTNCYLAFNCTPALRTELKNKHALYLDSYL